MIARVKWNHFRAEKMLAAAIGRETVRPAGEAKP
jgi:hypothetical protein